MYQVLECTPWSGRLSGDGLDHVAGVVILELDGAPVSKGGVEPFHVIDLIDEARKVRDDVREGLEAVAPAALDMLTAALRGVEKFASDKFADGEQAAQSEVPEDPTPPQGADSPGAGSSAPQS